MSKNESFKKGPCIKIVKTEDRFQIVKEVVNKFIDFEKDIKGKGIKFKYPVEKLSNNQKLYIKRPGRKKNFDFKVDIPKNSGLKRGSHDEIALVLRYLKEKNSDLFKKVWDIIRYLYKCKNNNVDEMLKQIPNSKHVVCVEIKKPTKTLENLIKLKMEIDLEYMLKIIKWLFIMEDVFYWDYEGRATLYNYLKYVIYEKNQDKLYREIYKQTKGGIRCKNLSPDDLKKLLREISQEWEIP